MAVHLVNPSHISFGVAVITPRWLFVLAAATPEKFGDPRITDETLEPFEASTVDAGDIVGIGIHTGNALRGYEIGTLARARGATVIYGGIHATLYPDEALARGGAHAVVKGDGDVTWPLVLDDATRGTLQPIYEGGRVDADRFVAGPVGPAARRTTTCGPRCRPCAAARSTARSARCGAPTARCRGSAAPTSSSKRSWSCAAAASASSPWPTTTSTR